jgi:hypothetical protein
MAATNRYPDHLKVADRQVRVDGLTMPRRQRLTRVPQRPRPGLVSPASYCLRW